MGFPAGVPDSGSAEQMADESGTERDDGRERGGLPVTTSWRSSLVVDLGGRILVTRSRAVPETQQRRDGEAEVTPRLRPAAELSARPPR